MACQTMSGVKKKAVAKFYAPQTVPLTWALSAQKAASGERHITPGKGNVANGAWSRSIDKIPGPFKFHMDINIASTHFDR